MGRPGAPTTRGRPTLFRKLQLRAVAYPEPAGPPAFSLAITSDLAIFVAMTLQFTDLPAIAFRPSTSRRLNLPAGTSWDGVFLGLDGEVFLRQANREFGWLLLNENCEELPLRRPDGNRFFIPFVQRFADGRWLVIEDAGSGGKDNAFIFGSDGKPSHSFYAGWGMQRVQVDLAGGIWVGYIDEAVIGGEKHFGGNGLVRLNEAGDIEFGFNTRLRQLGGLAGASEVFDIYALAVDEQGRAWLCPYTEFFLAYVDNHDIQIVLHQAPVPGADAIAVGGGYVAFFEGYDAPGIVTVLELETQRLRIIQLFGEESEPLPLRYLSTKGPSAVAIADDKLVRLDLDLLLTALGPWSDDNSSTVATTLEFQEKQSRDRGGGIIIRISPE